MPRDLHLILGLVNRTTRGAIFKEASMDRMGREKLRLIMAAAVLLACIWLWGGVGIIIGFIAGGVVAATAFSECVSQVRAYLPGWLRLYSDYLTFAVIGVGVVLVITGQIVAPVLLIGSGLFDYLWWRV